MIKNISSKTLGILGGFTIYAIVIYAKYDSIAQFMSNSNLVIALITYIIFNPAYMFVMYSIYTRFIDKRAWKRVIASVLTVFSLDFLAVPRLSITDALTDGPAITTNIGSIVMKALEATFSHNISYVLMYVILPILGLAIAVELLGITNFIKEIK